MTSRAALFCLLAVLCAAPARAINEEVKVGGMDGAKAVGTTAQPLRLGNLDAAKVVVIPTVGAVDVKTYDGPAGEAQVPLEYIKGQGLGTGVPAGEIKLVDQTAQAPQISAARSGEQGSAPAPGAKAELDAAGGGQNQISEQTPAENLEAGGRKEFDGQVFKTVASGAVTDTRFGRMLGATKAALSRGFKSLTKRSTAVDAYGGPQKLDLDLRQKLGYGVKWGFNMVGLATLLQGAAMLIGRVFSWQLHAPGAFLQATGRVELLAPIGPKAIAAALLSHPFHFLFVDLPRLTFWEEFGALSGWGMAGLIATKLGAFFLLVKGASAAAAYAAKRLERFPRIARFGRFSNKKLFWTAAALTLVSSVFPLLNISVAGLAFPALGARLLGFGLTWSVLAAVKPVTAKLAQMLESIPDMFGLRAGTQSVLASLGKVSTRAFPVAVVLSAAAFAVNHFAAWGFNPYYAAVHLAMGLSLGYTAYRARSFAVPFLGHYVYNLLTLGAGLLAVHFLMPFAASVYTLLISTAGVASLYFTYRSHQREKAAQSGKSGGFAAAVCGVLLPIILLGLTASAVLSPARQAGQINAPSAKAQIQLVQDTTEQKPAAPEIAPTDTTNAPAIKLSLGQMLDMNVIAVEAKTKPAVIKVYSSGKHGLGSGYIISPQGIAITNAHVTGAAQVGEELEMEWADGSHGTVKVLAFNHNKDIAILQLPKRDGGYPFIPLGDNSKIVEGQTVIAEGYPLGLPWSASVGRVSGLGNGRGSIYVQQLQTDAAINHGNSGGPLINLDGEVIGMNTAIAAPTPESGSIGIGFSITADDIKAALSEFGARGNINTSWIGVIVNTADPYAPDQGILVETVRPGSPAAKAGIRSGDLIIGIGKANFPKGRAGLQLLARAIAQKTPGTELMLRVSRGGDLNPVTVTLGDEKP